MGYHVPHDRLIPATQYDCDSQLARESALPWCCGWCRGIRQTGHGTALGPVLGPLGWRVGLGGGLLASWWMKTPPTGREKAPLPQKPPGAAAAS